MKVRSIEERMYDASMISDYLYCPKYFYYRYIRNITSKEEAAPLLFGRVFHEALLIWYRDNDLEKAVEAFAKIPSQMGDSRRTREHGEVIMRKYVKRWAVEPYVTKQLEVEFHLDMGEGRVYAGRIDKIAEQLNQIYVVDHKTSTQLGLSFFRSFRPHVQMDGYCFACRELCGQCSGAIINGVSLAANPKERFQRSLTPRTKRELDKFKVNFHKWCARIEIDVLKKEFVEHYTHCTKWGGKCDFWKLCVFGEDERTLREEFKAGEVM